jgi:photosystem I P700 chlorophyll a apoprotein A1
MYIHNDTLLALGRESDQFGDTGIPFRPVIGLLGQALLGSEASVNGTTAYTGIRLTGTADLLVHHIHAFTIHVTALINGWLRDFLWSESSQVIQSYGSQGGSYGLLFLGAHFVWAFSLMFLISWRGYWQELIESIVWAHATLSVAPVIYPRALSITQGRAVGITHYLLGGIVTTWAFFQARLL